MSRAGPPSRERGSATVLVLALVALICAAVVVCSAAGTLTVVRRTAAAAADAAALAGARAAVTGTTGQACAAAGTAAVLGHARLARCQVMSGVVTVTVVVMPPRWLSWAGAARLNARAGPAETNREKPVQGVPAS
jgi:secretion/DNA translocation related TadE-like protein